MRYMRHISPKTYHRPRLGRVCLASGIVLPPRRSYSLFSSFSSAELLSAERMASLPAAILRLYVRAASAIAAERGLATTRAPLRLRRSKAIGPPVVGLRPRPGGRDQWSGKSGARAA